MSCTVICFTADKGGRKLFDRKGGNLSVVERMVVPLHLESAFTAGHLVERYVYDLSQQK